MVGKMWVENWFWDMVFIRWFLKTGFVNAVFSCSRIVYV